eukprot:gene177-178_t
MPAKAKNSRKADAVATASSKVNKKQKREEVEEENDEEENLDQDEDEDDDEEEDEGDEEAEEEEDQNGGADEQENGDADEEPVKVHKKKAAQEPEDAGDEEADEELECKDLLARSSFIGRRDLIISLSDARAAKMPRKSEWENLVDEVEDAVVVVVGEAVEVVGEEELVTHSNEENVRAEARVGMHTRVGDEVVVVVEAVEEDEVGEVEAGVVEALY